MNENTAKNSIQQIVISCNVMSQICALASMPAISFQSSTTSADSDDNSLNMEHIYTATERQFCSVHGCIHGRKWKLQKDWSCTIDGSSAGKRMRWWWCDELRGAMMRRKKKWNETTMSPNQVWESHLTFDKSNYTIVQFSRSVWKSIRFSRQSHTSMRAVGARER